MGNPSPAFLISFAPASLRKLFAFKDLDDEGIWAENSDFFLVCETVMIIQM